jgi:hypothetical protein
MLKYNIYITCISILKYNKRGMLTTLKIAHIVGICETVFMPLCSTVR